MNLQKTQITTIEFLNEIHGANAIIFFNTGGITWKDKPKTYLDAESKLKWVNTEKHKDIYYIVNSGGSKDPDIIKINACFVDLDVGKDENGNYFPVSVVNERKAFFMGQVNRSPLIPTFIVETRNGYHIYWLLYPGTTLEQFTVIQKRIAYYFKGDPSVVNPARVMRLPGYYWIKPDKNCEKFYVPVISYNPVRYTFSELQCAFPSVSDDDFEKYKEQGKSPKPRKSAYNNSYNIYTSSIYVGTKPQNIAFEDMGKIIEYLKSINPKDYLKIQSDNEKIIFNCPFHNDTQPSANIYKYKKYYYFKCHSSKCNVGPLKIIDFVIKQRDCSTTEAIKVLMDFYNIRFDETWKQRQQEILDHNIDIISNIQDYEAQYPYLYKAIHRIKNDLITKLQFAKAHISFQSGKGELVFVCSLRKFEKLRTNGMSEDDCLGRQNERIDRYCLLGLMRKLNDHEIPAILLENAYEQRELIKNGTSTNMYRSQFYTIPEYTAENLNAADATVKKLTDANIRMNAISRDTVIQVFGLEKAKEIYPQINTNKISQSGEKLIPQIEKILLRDINANGYSKVIDIVAELQKEYDWKAVTDRRVKKYIPGLLVKNHLVEITATKILKEKYQIVCAGYPKIIIPDWLQNAHVTHRQEQ